MSTNTKTKVGALWGRKSNKGDKFLSGNIELNGEKLSLLVFKNGFKSENEKAPDFIIYQTLDDAPTSTKTEAKKVAQTDDDDNSDAAF